MLWPRQFSFISKHSHSMAVNSCDKFHSDRAGMRRRVPTGPPICRLVGLTPRPGRLRGMADRQGLSNRRQPSVNRPCNRWPSEPRWSLGSEPTSSAAPPRYDRSLRSDSDSAVDAIRSSAPGPDCCRVGAGLPAPAEAGTGRGRGRGGGDGSGEARTICSRWRRRRPWRRWSGKT